MIVLNASRNNCLLNGTLVIVVDKMSATLKLVDKSSVEELSSKVHLRGIIKDLYAVKAIYC